MLLTSTGRLCFFRSSANNPPNPPIAPSTSRRSVLRTFCLSPLFSVSARWMFTPAPAYAASVVFQSFTQPVCDNDAEFARPPVRLNGETDTRAHAGNSHHEGHEEREGLCGGHAGKTVISRKAAENAKKAKLSVDSLRGRIDHGLLTGAYRTLPVRRRASAPHPVRPRRPVR